MVQRALSGELETLSERMIGVELFGRPADYDTSNDAVVRVRAAEVRKRLAQYYKEATQPPVVSNFRPGPMCRSSIGPTDEG